uniref:Protein tyrosine phosphatase n=1 Tax=Trepomonas sp. PC1 TaxID=1076344 RepID=A0A146KGT3_9EUKA|eukprot:JAP95902.1 Protein tyrosine phosphatase [Trepomonas sp. PC1]
MEKTSIERQKKLQKFWGNKFQDKNRYQNILPYVHSQPPFYTNGNFVTLDGMDFFLTQAPVDIGEFHDLVFWLMPLQIIQVSSFVESGRLKANRYVPLVEGESTQFLHEGRQANVLFNQVFGTKIADFGVKTFQTGKNIRVQAENFFETEFYRKVDLVYEKIDFKAKIDFYQFYNWIDQEIAQFDQVFELCEKILEIDGLKMIHCSAGVGRSTAFAICALIMKQNRCKKISGWRDLSPSIYEMVEHFRVQRNPMCIQTVQQFKFLFEFADYVAQQ